MTPKKQLVSMLRLAHAIEVGAYQAYEGHWRTTKPIDNPVRGRIKWIQVDELLHREDCAKMLARLDSRPSAVLDSIMWVIGRLVTYSCYVSPEFAKSLGARLMESFAVAQYDTIAEIAERCGLYGMAGELRQMERKEKEHEEFFKSRGKA